MPIKTRRRALAGLLAAGIGVSVGAMPTLAAATVAPAAVQAPTPIALPVNDIRDVSANGRLVLAQLSGMWVVYDVVAGKTKRKLPTGGDPDQGGYRYFGLSDSGKFVTFSAGPAANGCMLNVPRVRNLATNKVSNVATDSKGHALLPAWATGSLACTTDGHSVPFGTPVISGNGRYVAFCANLLDRNREDLYVKDLRTRSITRTDGVCGVDTGDGEYIVASPRVSDNARVIFVSGNTAEVNGDGARFWDAGKLVIRGQGVLPGPGSSGGYLLVPDGSAIYVVGGTACPQPPPDQSCPTGSPSRFDVATSTLTVLPAADPGPGETSRHGRYVLGAPGAVIKSSIFDRQTGVTSALPAGVRWTLMSVDGRWVFGEDAAAWPLGSGTWYRVEWAAP